MLSNVSPELSPSSVTYVVVQGWLSPVTAPKWTGCCMPVPHGLFCSTSAQWKKTWIKVRIFGWYLMKKCWNINNSKFVFPLSKFPLTYTFYNIENISCVKSNMQKMRTRVRENIEKRLFSPFLKCKYHPCSTSNQQWTEDKEYFWLSALVELHCLALLWWGRIRPCYLFLLENSKAIHVRESWVL